ncbi:hypothetical protein WMY93_020935 [Mugilogobius chulae]|uniref:Hexosyltransferase n=1 Tax=Mugilogobius chulae TaxID=88201 RepID=A0AAW0NAE2_9GOBI
MTETTSTWTDQLWSHYLNTTSQFRRKNTTLRQLLFDMRTTTVYLNTTTKKALNTTNKAFNSTNMDFNTTNTTKIVLTTTQSPPALPAPPEYKSPGPYLVEYPYKYDFIINEPTSCEQSKPFLVLVVPVAPHNKEDRQIIRDTWGATKSVSGKNVALFFLLGLGNVDEKELSEESKQHKDIIQSNFVDCYKNLTIKTMVMLEWLDAHCRQATYAMKIDSDIFLNLPKLVEMLQHAPKSQYLTGLVERGAYVHRHQDSKWFVPYSVFSGNVYPPYALGLAYVLSMDLPKRLVEVSPQVKALYIEDVYLGMCMSHLGLFPTYPPFSGAFHVFPLRYNRCQYSRIIATTLDPNANRRQLWADFNKPGPYC